MKTRDFKVFRVGTVGCLCATWMNDDGERQVLVETEEQDLAERIVESGYGNNSMLDFSVSDCSVICIDVFEYVMSEMTTVSKQFFIGRLSIVRKRLS